LRLEVNDLGTKVGTQLANLHRSPCSYFSLRRIGTQRAEHHSYHYPIRGGEVEHRCGHRRAAGLKVLIRTRDGIEAEGCIINISSSGALIRCRPLGAATQVSVHFKSSLLAATELRRRLVVTGDVIRETANGFAVEWSQFSPPIVVSVIRQISSRNARRITVAEQPPRQ
jgi:hypothetical protein